MNWKPGDVGKLVLAKSGHRHVLDPALVHRTRAAADLCDRMVLGVQEEPVTALATASPSQRLLARERGRQKLLVLNGTGSQWIPGSWLMTIEEARRLWPNATAPRNG